MLEDRGGRRGRTGGRGWGGWRVEGKVEGGGRRAEG
jgi:hypothetical protein